MLGGMRLVRLAAVAAVFGWLAATAAGQRSDADEAALTATLAKFPDDGLPLLIERFVGGDDAVAVELAALGPAAHETLLGILCRHLGRRPPALLAAFGGFDASCGWALPILVAEPRAMRDQVRQELLLRLGPAAAPALDLVEDEALKQKLLAVSDGAILPGPSRPVVDPGLQDGLVERLRQGPSSQRWPALQALLRLGDDAAVAAAFALLELGADPECAAEAARLRRMLAYAYATRCRQGLGAHHQIDPMELGPEALRFALAPLGPGGNDAQRWATHPDPRVRRAAMLVAAETDTLPHQHWEKMLEALAAEADPQVRAWRDAADQARRQRAALVLARAVGELTAGDPHRRSNALREVQMVDLRDAPPGMVDALLAVAAGSDSSEASSAGYLLQRLPEPERWFTAELLAGAKGKVRTVLLDAASRGVQPPAVTAVLLGMTAEGEQERQALEQALRGAKADVLLRVARDVLRDPARRDRALRNLTLLRWTHLRQPVLAPLAAELAPLLAGLPPAGQLDLLELSADVPADAAVLTALLGAPTPELRLRAVRAWSVRREATPVVGALVVPLLDDADPSVASEAAWLLGRVTTDKQAAADALLARYHRDRVDVARLAALAGALGVLGEPSAVPALEAALQDPRPKVKQAAAQALLAKGQTHAGALAAFQELFVDPDPEVRRDAVYHAAGSVESAERVYDLAVKLLDDTHDMTAGGAARLMSIVPSRKEQSLPLLQALIVKWGRESWAAQHAQRAIERLSKGAAR